MNNYLKKFGIIIIVLITAIVCCFIKVRYEDRVDASGLNFTETLSENSTVIQKITPDYENLKQVGLVIWFNPDKIDSGDVRLQVLNQNEKELYSADIAVSELNIGAFYYFDTNLKLEKNKDYYFRISAENCSTSEPQLLTLQDGTLVHDYRYMDYAPYYVYGALITIMCMAVCGYLFLINKWSLWQLYKKTVDRFETRNFLNKKNYFRVCFLGCGLGFLQYTNGYTNEGQSTGLYLVGMFFGLATYGFLKKKEIVKVGNFLLAAVLTGAFIWIFKAKLEYIFSNPALFVFKYFATILWGVLLFITIIKIIKKEIKINQFLMVPVFLWVAYIASIAIFGIKEEWLLFVTVYLSIFYLIPEEKQDKKLFENAMMDSILILFVGITLFALAFRPFDLVRYPGVFHTTTAGSEIYLAVILTILFKLYKQIKERKKLSEMAYNLILWGVAWNYLLFTAARGAMIASVMGVLFTTVLLLSEKWKCWKNWKYIMYRMSLTVFVIIVLYPLTFCMQRSIPSIVNRPFHYPFELGTGNSVMEDDPITDSSYFGITDNLEVLYTRVVPGKLQIWINDLAKYDNITNNTDTGATNADTTDEGAGKKDIEEVVPVVDNTTSPGANTTDTANGEEKIVSEQLASFTGEAGRVPIYKAFLKQVGLFGKSDGMEVNGYTINSTQSTFIQVAYSYGVFAGVIFLMIVFLMCFRTGSNLLKKKTALYLNDENTIWQVLILIGFILYGILENGIYPAHILTFYFYVIYKNYVKKES